MDGTNPNIPTECGPRTEKYFWRSENYDDLTLADLASTFAALSRGPIAGASQTANSRRRRSAARRSSSAVDKFKKPIPETTAAPIATAGPRARTRSCSMWGRATQRQYGLLKSPPLTNIALTAPYLHDGSARSLEEIWTVYNPDDKHGRTNDLTKDELNDLIEYLRTR
jgi:cytochrome c peroxidase